MVQNNYEEQGTAEVQSSGLPLAVFDFHVHFPGELPYYRYGWEAWFARVHGEDKLLFLRRQQEKARHEFLQRYCFPLPEKTQPTAVDVVQYYDDVIRRYGLAGILFVTGVGGNRALAEVLRGHSKLYGLAHHDPFNDKAAEELEVALSSLGLRGYKLLATALRRPITSPRLQPLWEVCARHEAPVLIHFGPLGGGSGIAFSPNVNPLILHDVAKAYPHVPFVVPHFGVGYIKELLQLMWACENVLVDTSGSNQWRHYTWPEPSLVDMFRVFYTRFGSTRIVFGTDSSYFPRGWVLNYVIEQLRAAEEAGISTSGLEEIFSINAKRLLKVT